LKIRGKPRLNSRTKDWKHGKFMKTPNTLERAGKPRLATTLAVMLAVVAIGCGKKTEQSTVPAPAATIPVTEPILAAWQIGDQATAIRHFLEADWSARPLFASNLVLNLRRDQLQSLPRLERERKDNEGLVQACMFSMVGGAVLHAGREAAAQQNVKLALRHFGALRRCGEALDNPVSLSYLQEIGRAMKRSADAEIEKLEARQANQVTSSQE
jgi:hypothetical protein